MQGSPPQLVSGLSQIAGRYKALLLDQFGVLHDGRKPYPGAVEAVAAAAAAGLRLLIISNSSRRAGGTLDKLAAMGFDRSCFAGVVTSGELTHRYLTQRPDAWWTSLGRRCVHINWSRRGPVSLEGYGLEVVPDPADADFILAHGTEGVSDPTGGVQERPLEALKQMLVQAAVSSSSSSSSEAEAPRGSAAGTRPPPPLVVANPDVVTVDGDELVAMPGSLAAAYAAAGGRVVLMGKPAPLIYAAAGDVLELQPGELLAVGDSLEHDIAGAAAAGIDSLFVAGGIHARDVLVGPAASSARRGLGGQPQEDGGAAGPQSPGSKPEEEAGEAQGVAEVEEQGVDMAALQRLVDEHLGSRGRGAHGAEAAGGYGAGGDGGAEVVAPTYVVTRFRW